MNKSFLHTIEKYKMLQAGDSVLIGLSGGADSVCLCHLLYMHREKLGIRVRALHVNHGIRGAEAQRDAAFCASFCESYAIPLQIVSVDVPAECQRTKESTETCARRLRYAALQAACQPQEKIATAHNASDNAETVLLHMARGTGLKGLCGIPPVRGNIIRPLLAAERSEIEQYCAQNGLDYVTDSTNLSKSYARNRIRMEALPALHCVNSAFLRNITRMTELLTQEESLLADYTESALQQAENENGLSVKALRAMPQALALRTVHTWLSENGCTDTSLLHAGAVLSLCESGSSFALPHGRTVYRFADSLQFQMPPEGIQPWTVPFAVSSARKQLVQTPCGTVQIEHLFSKDLQNLYKQPFYNAVDCAKIKSSRRLRSRQEGDFFTSRARRVTKSLKKWFNEMKIPPEQRNAVPILDSGGQAVWVYGLGVSAQFQPDESTSEILVLTLQDGGNTNE